MSLTEMIPNACGCALAFGLRDAREQNGKRVAQFLRCLSVAAGEERTRRIQGEQSGPAVALRVHRAAHRVRRRRLILV